MISCWYWQQNVLYNVKNSNFDLKAVRYIISTWDHPAHGFDVDKIGLEYWIMRSYIFNLGGTKPRYSIFHYLC